MGLGVFICEVLKSFYGYSLNLLIILIFSAISNLTHWSRVKHVCVSELTIIGSDNGLSPGQRQAIIWTSARTLLIGP